MRCRIFWFPGAFGVWAVPDLGDERTQFAPAPSPPPIPRAVVVRQGGALGRNPGSAALAAVLLMTALFAVVAAIA